MTMILTGLGIAYLINWSYHNGRRDGDRGGWQAAWRQARERFRFRRRG
jgi:hypothetical protein